jgi:hypothetical protein
MSKATKRSAYAKTADAKLFALHDKFCEAYIAMQSLEAGAGAPSTKKGDAFERKWDRAVSRAFDKARAVIEAPAYTLEGMLMKLHIVGFTVDYRKRDSFSAPYHGMICSNGRPQEWEMQEDLTHPIHEERALILSLRSDLQRFAGRRT